ncbi:MAG: hypothetical protein ACQESJ_06390 [Bacteroidota bacterium]
MANTKNHNTPEYRLSGIELLDMHLYHENRLKRESKEFHFNINIEHKINIEKKLVFAITSINVLHEDKETLLGSIKVACNFEVKNLEDFTNQEKKTVDFPKEMLTALNAVSISTTRGVMFANFSGTFLHKAHLPLIDPKEFTKKNN